MNLNHIWLQLLYYTTLVFTSELPYSMEEEPVYCLPDWVVQTVSPEGATMLETYSKPPRIPRHEHFRASTDSDRIYADNYLNCLDLNDTESEDEAEELVRTNSVNDLFILTVYNYCFRVSQESMDLNEELFRAAIESDNIKRLRLIFAKKKHLLLTKEQKVKTFKVALISCKSGKDANMFAEIFKLLLQHEFYPSDCVWPSINRREDTIYPLTVVLFVPILYQTFLDYDKNIFAKERVVNYVKILINMEYYTEAKRALRLGFNPRINETSRNVLDYTLDDPYFTPSTDQEQDRQDLIRILQEEYGMESSNTIRNLERICQREEDWERAIKLVQLGGMNFRKKSPIGIAFSYMNLELIHAAIDTYADNVSIDQLKSDLACYKPTSISDLNQRIQFDEAVKRIKILKNMV